MKRALLAVTLAVGCGGDSDEADDFSTDGSCVLADGTYELRYQQLSGTCPTIQPEVMVIQGEDALVAGDAEGVECNRTGSCEDGSMAATSDCTFNIQGVRGEKHDVMSLDVQTGAGTYSVRLLGGGESCNGTYDLDMVRLR